MRRIVVVLVLMTAACSGQGQFGTQEGSGQLAEEPAGGDAAGAPAADPAARPAAAAPDVRPSVIKTANLEVEVPSDAFGRSISDVGAIAARHGGYVVSTSVGGADARRGSTTIRVPAERFEQALGEIRALGEVRSETVSGQDVGQEFVDLEARLRNLQAQEAVLLRLYDEAATIQDTIRVQQEVSNVQLQIEEIRGRLNYLQDQTAFGTISVALAEEGVAAPGLLERAWDAAIDGFVGVVAGAIVVLGYVLPFAIVAGLGFLIFRRVRRREPEEPITTP